MSGTTTCARTRALLPGYVLGDLAAADVAAVGAHLAACAPCAAEERALRAADRLLAAATDAAAVPARLLRAATASARREARWGTVASPIGALHVAVSDAGVLEVGFGWQEGADAFVARVEARGFTPVADAAAVAGVADELGRYFAGERRVFAAAIDWTGVTTFMRAVLEATVRVPFGQVATYRDIAVAAGNPGAVRAVGNALHRNPVPVIVPCHRIVRSDLTLGGYAGGLDAKRRLLALEGAMPATATLF
jgi:methylated-DNA-[protein]-cysteine S-methyltransferase